MACEVSLVPVLPGAAPALLGSRELRIDEESAIYGDTQMMCSEITGITYAIHSVQRNEIDGEIDGGLIVLRSKTIKNTKLKIAPHRYTMA